MRTRAVNRSTGDAFAERVLVCDRLWTRAKGLLGTKELPPDRACLIEPCASVHTFGMRYPIDCYFLDASGRVLSVRRRLEPNRTASHPGARAVLETAARPVPACEPGDRVVFERSAS